MHDRTNTIAGWVLFGGIAALGLSIVTNKYFHGEAHAEPGFVIEGGEEAGGGDAGPSFTALLAASDVAKGEAVFKKCTACHTIEAGGANGIGPNLHGVVGKPHAAHPGFSFSAALKGVPGNWDFDALDAWLKSPKKYAPGTLMSFAGLSKAEDRANLVAYLNSQGSNLPLPAAPVEEAAPEGNEASAAEATAPADAVVSEAAATSND